MKHLLTLLLFISTSAMADVKTMHCIGTQLVGNENSATESNKNVIIDIADEYFRYDGERFPPYSDEMGVYLKDKNTLRFSKLLTEGEEWSRSVMGKYHLKTNEVEFEDHNLKNKTFEAFVGECNQIKTNEDADKVCVQNLTLKKLPNDINEILIPETVKHCTYLKEDNGSFYFSAANGFDYQKYDFDNNGEDDYLIVWANSGSGGYDYEIYLSNKTKFTKIDIGQNSGLWFDQKLKRFIFDRHGVHCDKGGTDDCFFEATISNFKVIGYQQIQNNDEVNILLQDEERMINLSSY